MIVGRGVFQLVKEYVEPFHDPNQSPIVWGTPHHPMTFHTTPVNTSLRSVPSFLCHPSCFVTIHCPQILSKFVFVNPAMSSHIFSSPWPPPEKNIYNILQPPKKSSHDSHDQQKWSTHPSIDQEIHSDHSDSTGTHLLFFGRAGTTTGTAGGLSVGIRFGIYRDLTCATGRAMGYGRWGWTQFPRKNRVKKAIWEAI